MTEGATALIDTFEALQRTDLFATVKAALKAADGSGIDVLCPSARLIADAVRDGWFMFPAGRNLAYSKAQYFPIHRLLEATPWHIALTAHAERAASRIRVKVGEWRYEQLWSHPQGLTSPTLLAKHLPHKTPRLPFEWKAGEITVDLLVKVLRDNYEISHTIWKMIDCMQDTEALTVTTSIGSQFNAFVEYGQSFYIKELLQSTRRMYLDPEASRALADTISQGKPGEFFEAFLVERSARAEDTYRAAWLDVYGRIHYVARTFENMSSTSEHLGTVNRRLQADAGRDYKMFITPTSTGDQLTLSLGGNYVSGLHVDIQSHWEFKNWIIALSQILVSTTPTFDAYMLAEKLAKERIDLAGGYASPRPAWRPHDDFETNASPLSVKTETQHQQHTGR